MCSASASGDAVINKSTLYVQSGLKYNNLCGKCPERIHYNTLHWVTRQQQIYFFPKGLGCSAKQNISNRRSSSIAVNWPVTSLPMLPHTRLWNRNSATAGAASRLRLLDSDKLARRNVVVNLPTRRRRTAAATIVTTPQLHCHSVTACR